jgi:multiple sugar transport system substrate-binding protein
MRARNQTGWRLAPLVAAFLLTLAACDSTGGGATSTTEAVEAATTAPQTADETTTTEPTPAEEATVSYWHTMSEPETAQLDAVIAAFEAANPGITVEPTRYAYDDFKAALTTSIAGGEAPDTARLDIIWVPEFAELGALLPLDAELASFDEIASAVFPGPLATNHWDGSYYGLPQNTNTQVLLWNSDVFEAAGVSEPPATLDEFATTACALSDADAGTYGYGMGGTYFWAPAPIFYSSGGAVVDEGITTATGYVNGPESVAAFELLTGLYNDGCLSPSILGGGVGTAEGHATGAYATIIDGPWMVDIYRGDFPDFEVNFAPIPAGPDGSTSSVVGGENVVVFADTDQKDAALAWTHFLMSEESQRLLAEVGVVPTLASLAGDPALPEYFDVFMTQLETAQARVPHPRWGDMDTAINEAFQRMLQGTQTPQEALDQAAEEINALLQ